MNAGRCSDGHSFLLVRKKKNRVVFLPQCSPFSVLLEEKKFNFSITWQFGMNLKIKILLFDTESFIGISMFRQLG